MNQPIQPEQTEGGSDQLSVISNQFPANDAARPLITDDRLLIRDHRSLPSLWVSRHGLHRGSIQFDQRVVLQGMEDGGHLAREQLLQFPRADVARPHQQQLPRPLVQHMGIVKVCILGNDNAVFRNRQLVDNSVAGFIPRRQSGRVQGVVSCGLKEGAEAGGPVRVHEELHAKTRCWLFNCSDRLANSRHASKSSRSRSGNSTSTSSNESPAARYSSMDSTGYRNPRMAGFPWQISGLIVMRDSSEFIRHKTSPSDGHAQAPQEQHLCPVHLLAPLPVAGSIRPRYGHCSNSI